MLFVVTVTEDPRSKLRGMQPHEFNKNIETIFKNMNLKNCKMSLTFSPEKVIATNYLYYSLDHELIKPVIKKQIIWIEVC